jgi:hypothetical protein
LFARLRSQVGLRLGYVLDVCPCSGLRRFGAGLVGLGLLGFGLGDCLGSERADDFVAGSGFGDRGPHGGVTQRVKRDKERLTIGRSNLWYRIDRIHRGNIMSP